VDVDALLAEELVEVKDKIVREGPSEGSSFLTKVKNEDPFGV
jgi:hypothetical protein